MQPGDLIEYRLANHPQSLGLVVGPVTDRDGRAGLQASDRPAYWIAWLDGDQQTWAFEKDLTLIAKGS